MTGGPQQSHSLTRQEADYFAFADQCAGAGEPLDTFYPSTGARPTRAKQLCDGCPVRVACLAYALKYKERYGVWGGMSESERRELARVQRRGLSLQPILKALA